MDYRKLLTRSIGFSTSSSLGSVVIADADFVALKYMVLERESDLTELVLDILSTLNTAPTRTSVYHAVDLDVRC